MNPALLCLPDTFWRHSYFSAQATLFGATPLEHYSRPNRSTQNAPQRPLPRPPQAMQRYVRRSDKQLAVLAAYAQQLGISGLVSQYLEVLL